MDIFSLDYNPILRYLLFKLFQLWPLGVLPVSACIPLLYPDYFVS